jgi:hypothetical protein
MRWKPALFLPALLLCAAAGVSIRAQDSEEPQVGETGVREATPGSGWKGLPGAKDPGEPGVAPGWIEVELKIVPIDGDFGYRTPLDSIQVTETNRGAWVDVSNGILPLTGVKGGPIAFKAGGAKTLLDLDGDGEFETPQRGPELLAARVKRRDGTEGMHHFRLRRDDTRYLFNRACVAVGKIGDVAITFIDENNNGHYGDPEADAMRIGTAAVAQYTSEVIGVAGKLYYLRVNQSATKAWYKPFDGPTGCLDMALRWKGKSKPLFAMFKQGEVIIDAAGKATLVPAGTWNLFEGVVGPTIQQSARIKPGAMKEIVVKEGETTAVAWGMPGKIDFSVSKNGNLLTMSSGSVRIYGSAGEEYVEFRPKRFTPNVHVVDQRTKKDIMNKNMGAGC